MPTNEIKAAAKRRRAAIAANNKFDGGYVMSDEGRRQSLYDAYILADAYLAEHPADDDEPATAEWLLTLPNAGEVDDCVYVTCGDIDINLYESGSLAVETKQTEAAISKNPTRGQVRRLIAALEE